MIISLTIIAKKSDGALRDAESYFDQVVSFCGNKIDSETVAQMLNLVDDEIYFEISDAILDKDFKAVFDVTKKIYENGWDFVDFTSGLIEHFRNVMTVIITENTDLVETAEIYRIKYMDYLDKFSEGDLLRLLNYLNKVQQELRYTQNQKLKVEIALSHLIGLERSSTISDVISKISDGKAVSQMSSPPAGSGDSINSKKKVEPQKSIKQRTDFQPVQQKENGNNKNNGAHNEADSSVFNFDSLISKWQGFVKEVATEKPLMLGQFIHSLTPVSLDGNKLNISSTDSHVKDLLRTNENYFAKKSYDYFGKRINFNYIEETTGTSRRTAETENPAQTHKPGSSRQEDDPFVSAIINELGGEEIR